MKKGNNGILEEWNILLRRGFGGQDGVLEKEEAKRRDAIGGVMK
jgi:hypothetical protein